ncbi:hypothetical protein PM10SUCC1_22360 [Propionigenium maris DSM 9537]|uniref:Uncharacterized protein n=1 Tax=Propionigenium maris DSM 9537 TaxID=1123000 RepID=A0A9W6GLZ6_9FUSO|nr:hypothetical protein [Propionigenium maris]GLI56722.1 hypothetical protein PM10SUCC1_22360 [Propionigenium maris DSM 9537]
MRKFRLILIFVLMIGIYLGAEAQGGNPEGMERVSLAGKNYSEIHQRGEYYINLVIETKYRRGMYTDFGIESNTGATVRTYGDDTSTYTNIAYGVRPNGLKDRYRVRIDLNQRNYYTGHEIRRL